MKQTLQKAGVNLDVMVLNASKFYHLGTMQEFLEGTCTHTAFMHELNIRNTHPGVAVVDSQPNSIPAGTRNEIVQPPIYIENVVLAPEARIHPCSIIVDSVLPNDAIVPRDSCIFTLQLQDHEFVTFTFSVKDDMKRMARAPATATVSALTGEESIVGIHHLLIFERVPLSDMLSLHSAHPPKADMLEAQSAGLSLWNAPVFEIARTAQESVRLALDRLDRIRNFLDGTLAEGAPKPDVQREPKPDIVGWISLKNAARKAREYV